jgi:hypothetical protein
MSEWERGYLAGLVAASLAIGTFLVVAHRFPAVLTVRRELIIRKEDRADAPASPRRGPAKS